MRLVIWDKTSDLILPNGSVNTPQQIFQQYPMTAPNIGLVIVLEMQGNMTVAIDNLDTLRQIYQLGDNLTDDEAVAEAERIRKSPPTPAETAETRIAAALEEMAAGGVGGENAELLSILLGEDVENEPSA